MDPDRPLRHGYLLTRKQQFLFHVLFRGCHQSAHPIVQANHPRVLNSTPGSALCCLVLLHDSLLLDAAAAKLLGHGNVVVSIRE